MRVEKLDSGRAVKGKGSVLGKCRIGCLEQKHDVIRRLQFEWLRDNYVRAATNAIVICGCTTTVRRVAEAFALFGGEYFAGKQLRAGHEQ